MEVPTVRNPDTGRQIRVGGETYRQLVRAGKIEEVDESLVLARIEPDMTKEDIIRLRQRVDEDLPDGVQSVRGRGAYANTLVERKMAPREGERAPRYAPKQVRENVDWLSSIIEEYFDEVPASRGQALDWRSQSCED